MDQAEAAETAALIANESAPSPSVSVASPSYRQRTASHRKKMCLIIALSIIATIVTLLLVAHHTILPGYIQHLVAVSPPPRIDSAAITDLTEDGAMVQVSATLDAELPAWTRTLLGVQALRVGSTVWSLHFADENGNDSDGEVKQWRSVGEMRVPEFTIDASAPVAAATVLLFESRIVFYDDAAGAHQFVARLQAGSQTGAATRFKLLSNPSMHIVGGWLPFSWPAIPLVTGGAVEPAKMPKMDVAALNVTVEMPDMVIHNNDDNDEGGNEDTDGALRVAFNNPVQLSLRPGLLAVGADIHYDSVHLASLHLYNLTLDQPAIGRQTGHLRLAMALLMDRPGVSEALRRLMAEFIGGNTVLLSVQNVTVYTVNGRQEVPVPWLNRVLTGVNVSIPLHKNTPAPPPLVQSVDNFAMLFK